MNNIKINIYSSSINFTKLYLDLDKKIIILNEKNINLRKDNFITIVNYIFDVTEYWDDIEKVDVGSNTEIEVIINMSNKKTKYLFTQNVPVNIYKIYELIQKLEKINYE